MKGAKIAIGIIGMLVRLPIWFFLVYTLLCVIHPDRLIWFLFWIYVPAGVVEATLQVIVSNAETKKANDTK